MLHLDVMNDLYSNELRPFMNLFMLSMKLLRKERIVPKWKGSMISLGHPLDA